MSPDPRTVAGILAAAFLESPWDSAADLVLSGVEAVGASRRRLTPTANAVFRAYREPPSDRHRELAAYIVQLDVFDTLCRNGVPEVRRHPVPLSAMGSSRWPVPSIATVGELADWASMSVAQLDGYADVQSLERTGHDRLRHYDRTWIFNRRGRVRLLESPRSRLKTLQRQVLDDIIGLIPVHDAAHGFVPGRSVLTFSAPHAGRDVVVRLDLASFFASIAAGRVYGVLRSAGYPEAVCHTMTGLVTTVIPRPVERATPEALRHEDVEPRRQLLRLLAQPHLPQGAPTSPALANLVVYRLDARLEGLARASDAVYTRYADDLAFSFLGPEAARRARRLVDAVRAVVAEEGFRVNHAKTRLTSTSQRQRLCGVVVNERPGVARNERDDLRALLHNCVRYGPQDQNRSQHVNFRAHLLGRIAWVSAVNAAQGARLRQQFDQIVW